MRNALCLVGKIIMWRRLSFFSAGARVSRVPFQKHLHTCISNFSIDNQFVHLNMPVYKLDRTTFKAQTVSEAAEHSFYYQNKSWQERLKIAAYLNSVAFNYPLKTPPRMDKTKFKAGSRICDE